MLGISAPINDGNQHDKQVNKPQQLEGNPPASPGPLLIQGSEDQFLQGLSLPVAVVIRRLGVSIVIFLTLEKSIHRFPGPAVA